MTRLLKPLVDHRLARKKFRKASAALRRHDAANAHAAALLPAIDALVKSGELREELLPMLWEPLGLHKNDYGDVLLMMSASGVLFLAEHTQQDRRWVMPMRLADSQPPDAKERWNEDSRNPDVETLSLKCRLGRIAPPGISERLMASCYGFGRYHRFWKRGALIQPRSVHNSSLLIELKAAPNTDGATSAKLNHELMMEIRGPKAARAEMWAMLLQVRKLGDLVLDDFPGLPLSTELRCPRLPRRPGPPPRADDVARRRHDDAPAQVRAVRRGRAAAARQGRPGAAAEAALALAPPRRRHRLGARRAVGGQVRRREAALRQADRARLRAAQAARHRGGPRRAAPRRGRVGHRRRDHRRLQPPHRRVRLERPRLAQVLQGRARQRHEADAPARRVRRRRLRRVRALDRQRGRQGAGLRGLRQGPPQHEARRLPRPLRRRRRGPQPLIVLALRLYTSSVYRSVNKPLHDGCSLERPYRTRRSWPT